MDNKPGRIDHCEWPGHAASPNRTELLSEPQMKPFTLICLYCFFLSNLIPSSGKANRLNTDNIEGDWVPVTAVRSGEEWPLQDVFKVRLRKGRLEIGSIENRWIMIYKTRGVGRIDLSLLGYVHKGLYKVENDLLILLWESPGKKRPIRISPALTNTETLLVLRRKK